MVSASSTGRQAAGCAAVLLYAAGLASGDAYMVYPPPYSRSDLSGVGCSDTGTGVASDCPGPCDTPFPSSGPPEPLKFERGENLTVNWATNGSGGGFVQLAVLKRQDDLSDEITRTSFYTSDAIRRFVCFEPYQRCRESSNLTYTDSNGVTRKSTVCAATLSIGVGMDDGMYTIQWTWFGGFDSATSTGTGDHFSCANIEVNGGYKSPDLIVNTPTFQGGDVQFPGEQRCGYRNTRKPFQCVYEPCRNSTWTGDNQPQEGVPAFALLQLIDPVAATNATSPSLPPQGAGAHGSEPTQRPAESADQPNSTLALLVGVGLPTVSIALVAVALYFRAHRPSQKTYAGGTTSTQILRTAQTSTALGTVSNQHSSRCGQTSTAIGEVSTLSLGPVSTQVLRNGQTTVALSAREV